MIYCRKCILPSSRPGLKIGSDGICNACKTNSLNKSDEIDWVTVKGLSLNCKEASNRKGLGGRTILHYACANGAPVDVIQAMLEHHPASAGLADRSRGWLPLHYAVACACAAANAARSLKKKQKLIADLGLQKQRLFKEPFVRIHYGAVKQQPLKFNVLCVQLMAMIWFP